MTYAGYAALVLTGFLIGRFALRGFIRSEARRIMRRIEFDEWVSDAREELGLWEEKDRIERNKMRVCTLCWNDGPRHLREELHKPLPYDVCRDHRESKARRFYGMRP